MSTVAEPQQRVRFRSQTARHSRSHISPRARRAGGLAGLWLASRRRGARTWFDASADRHHGDLVGGAPWQTSGFGWAPNLDGVNDAAILDQPNDPYFRFVSGFTLGLLIRPVVAGIAQYDVAFSCSENGGQGWRLWTRDALTPRWYWECYDGGFRNTISTDPISGDWQFITAIHDGTDLRLYIDGIATGAPAACGNILYAAGTRTAIGCSPLNAAGTTFRRHFPGQVALAVMAEGVWDLSELQRTVLPRSPQARLVVRIRAPREYRDATMALDLHNDYQVFDGLIPISLDGHVIADVLMLQSKIKEGDPTDGAYLHRDTKFHLPATLPLIPAVGQILLAAGVSYTVQAIREPFLNDAWILTCREVSITADTELQDLITRYPAVHTVDRQGSKRTTHPDASATFTDIPGKVQIQPSATEDEAGKRGFRKRYAVYVSADVDELQHGDLLKDQNAKQFTIDSWRNRERIDEHSVILCSTPPGA